MNWVQVKKSTFSVFLKGGKTIIDSAIQIPLINYILLFNVWFSFLTYRTIEQKNGSDEEVKVLYCSVEIRQMFILIHTKFHMMMEMRMLKSKNHASA
jgi:hypothetical protein